MNVKGKKCLCKTLLSDWNVERVNNVEFFKRYSEYVALFSKNIPDVDFQDCFAQPVFDEDNRCIEWFYVPSQEIPHAWSEDDSNYTLEKERIFKAIKKAYQSSSPVEGAYLKTILDTLESDIADKAIYCHDGKVTIGYWGLRPKKGVELNDVIINDVRDHRTHTILYSIRGEGNLSFERCIRMHGHEINAETDVPHVTPQQGFLFNRWEPDSPFGQKVTKDLQFFAVCEKDPLDSNPSEDTTVSPNETQTSGDSSESISTNAPKHFVVRFNAGEHGILSGNKEVTIAQGGTLQSTDIPSVNSKENFVFDRWDYDLTQPINEDISVTALYKEAKDEDSTKDPKVCWWKRWKLSGCLLNLLKLLLGLLLFALLVCLIGWLLTKCSGPTPPPPPPPIIVDPDNPTPVVVDPVDTIREPITQRPIVADRINVLVDDEELMLEQVMSDFKAMYPSDDYEVIYADENTKRLQIRVPRSERERMCDDLALEFVNRFPERYSEETVFVFSEAMLGAPSYTPNDPHVSQCWYLDAIEAKDAWEVTMGSDEVVVAIVDNGFDLRHEDLKEHVFKPYNVYTRGTDVNEDSRSPHGSHVAGTAIALADNNRGISGIAPKCKFMPVKVADNYGNLYTSAIVDGILYATYSGADVINVSIGTTFPAGMPIPIQLDIINSYYKAEERLWRKVFEITSKHNVVVVLAAGNENLMADVDPMHRSTNAYIVSAVSKEHDPRYHKANFSNYGAHTTISAPGVDILSSVHNSEYETMNGTSMAAPIVTGAVALIKSVNPHLTPMQIRDILQSTAIPTEGNIAKLLQLGKAVRKAANEKPDTTSTPILHSGDIELTLRWDGYNDIDLACIEPNGVRINFQNRESPTGGLLEVDMNAGDRISATPLEHIYWPDNSAPHGQYQVVVSYYSANSNSELVTPYELTIIKYKQDTTRYVGELGRVKEKHVVSFTL